MPSSKNSDDEGPSASYRKSTTPRRSPAVKRRANATPNRKLSSDKAATPNSAPARAKLRTRKAEPTLLGDFLLGRPSVNRSRRKSLDVVRTEVKRSAVNKLQPPGGVKDMVKQWQKASATAAVEEGPEPLSEPNEIFVDVDEESVTERDRRRIKFRKAQTPSPGRRKSNEKKTSPVPERGVKSPKKRVLSDDRWLTKEDREKSLKEPEKVALEEISKGASLSKQLLKTNAANPPLAKKIEDWAKRTTSDEGRPKKISNRASLPKNGLKTNTVNPVLARKIEDWEKRTATDEATPKEKRVMDLSDDHLSDDCMQSFPSGTDSKGSEIPKVSQIEGPSDDGFRAIPVSSDTGWQARGDVIEEYHTPKGKDRKNPKSFFEVEAERNASFPDRGNDGEKSSPDPYSTPTQPSRRKTRRRKSSSPDTVTDIPVGYSAFSVLDIPVGGDASGMKPSKPQRHASLSAVPKALKKVYTEGLKIVQDTVDPPRVGVNQPPSIESWLKGTSDPFLDDVPISASAADLPMPKPKRRSYEVKMKYENQDILEDKEGGGYDSQAQRRRVGTTQNYVDTTSVSMKSPKTSTGSKNDGGRNISDEFTSPLSPTGLKRSPAMRNTSSSRSLLETAFREPAVNSSTSNFEPHAQRRPPTLRADSTKESSDMNTRSSRRPTCGRELGAYERNFDNTQEEKTPRGSPRPPNTSILDKPATHVTEQVKLSTRRDVLAPRRQHLSTIASVETFSSSSSVTETTSELSQTTVTQTSVTQITSSTSEVSSTRDKNSTISRQRSNDPGLKRRLTKHSDLLSVLSLSGGAELGKSKSIKSARSVRTPRSHLSTATIPDLLRELASDEVKYMRELKTLVDGVIPVLLTCVVSKSESAVVAGLFDPASEGRSLTSMTKPIVDMGIALEQLKSLHKRIPLQDAENLVHWASRAHIIYGDYLAAWRMGFQDIIVSLAPASGTSQSKDELLPGEMPRNEDGDVLNDKGERVDVEFLLKRPLVRVKYLAKVMKGLYTLKPSEQTAKADEKFQDLLAKARRRMKEEEARLVDEAANNTDAMRVRDPRTLAPMEGIVIDRTRQVSAKDFFDFSFPHSNGQRIDCRVEVLLRDKPQDQSDKGDVLICEVNTLSRWLLFPPIELDLISARPGDAKGELVVMIRGRENSYEWSEVFVLSSEDEETALEWMRMLSLTPEPPHLLRTEAHSVSALPMSRSTATSESQTSDATQSPRTPNLSNADVPIGERRRVAAENRRSLTSHTLRKELPNADESLSAPHKYKQIFREEVDPAEYHPKDLNDAMAHAGDLSNRGLKRTSLRGDHSRQIPELQACPQNSSTTKDLDRNAESTSILPLSSSKRSPRTHRADNRSSVDVPGAATPEQPLLPLVPVSRGTQPLTVTYEEKHSSPLRESMRPDGMLKKDFTSQPPASQAVRDDCPPPPPPHRTPTSATFKEPPSVAVPTLKSRSRRTSSPLKHEYQPSNTSSSHSASEDSDSGNYEDSSNSSEDDELEAVDMSTPLPDLRGFATRISPAASFDGLPNGSLAPSNSASQAPYCRVPSPSQAETTRLVAAISCWSRKGHWVDLYPDDCSIVISPGLIEAFMLSSSHCSRDDGKGIITSGSPGTSIDMDVEAHRPLVALELTPVVPLRQSNALDIEIRSPPTARSSVKCTHTVRFRSRTLQECSALYAAIHKSRMENPVYKKLEQERIVNTYGRQLYQAAGSGNRRRSWFGRSKSYRASTRAPSVTISDNSANSFASAIARLKNIGRSGEFNIANSSVGTTQGDTIGTSSGGTSLYASTNSASSGIMPSRTPTSPSNAASGTTNIASLGSSNLKIRLYRLETSSRWSEFGNALLTVTHPPRGMRQASSLYHGIEKRIIVTKKHVTNRRVSRTFMGSGYQPKNDEASESTQLILDVVLGAGCFSRLGVVGIALNVWEDIVGDNGEVGRVGAVGGVSGRTRKWMFQCATAAEATWIFALVGGGGR